MKQAHTHQDNLPFCQITTHEDIPESEALHIDAGLGAANSAAAPLHEVRPLACFARSTTDEEQAVGGVIGRTWGQCAELQQLWVEPAFRQKGIGAQLIRTFEETALARGCTLCYLETFSFQAPVLYQSMGYEIKLELQGFAPGIVKYVMTRDLTAAPKPYASNMGSYNP